MALASSELACATPMRLPMTTRTCNAVAYVHRLDGLALAAVGSSPQLPVIAVADRVAAAPELRRDAGVSRVLQQGALLAALDLPRQLGAELEVQPFVVDAPALV